MPFRPSLFSAFCALCGVFVLSGTARSADIFVDYANGRDENSGLSREAPWRHAPGDPAATARAHSYDPEPGDVIYFKGGVEYLGNIVVPESGDKDEPITYKGSGWGDSPALLSGAKNVGVSFKPCASAADCYGNPNWEHLVKSAVPAKIPPLTPVFADGKRIWLSREPNQPDPFWFDDIHHYATLEPGDSDNELTSSYLRLDPEITGTSEENWRNAFVSVWMIPNWILINKVTGFDPATGTIHFKKVQNKPYTDRESYYAFFNRPSDVDQPGEYSIDNIAGTILLWPENMDRLPQTLKVSSRDTGFDINGKSNIVIEGFHISFFFGGQNQWQSGTAVINSEGDARNIIVRNNVIDHMKSTEGVGLIQLDHTRDSIIENNRLENNQKSSGIRLQYSQDIIIRDNIIRKIGRTGVRLIDTNHIQITGNRISGIRGVHGNGISIYLKNRNILVADNIIHDAPFAFTYHGTGKPEEANNLWLLNNVILGRMSCWGNHFASVVLLHNLIYAPEERGKALQIPADEPPYVIKNNIIDGLVINPRPTSWNMSGNIYTALSWNQSSRYGWRLEENGDIDQGIDDEIEAFTKSRPPIDRNMGESISLFLPVSTFPEFDFSHWMKAEPIGPSFIPMP